MLRPRNLSSLILAAVVAGCAAAEPGFMPPSPLYDKLHNKVATGGGMTSDGRYILNDQEAKLDCKKINGSIHVGILQLREAADRRRPSAIASQIQKMTSHIGGSAYGMDLDSEAARARARLEALNARLAEKNCPTFDLEAELKPGNTASPTPARSAKAR